MPFLLLFTFNNCTSWIRLRYSVSAMVTAETRLRVSASYSVSVVWWWHADAGSEQYCQFETFNVTCPPGQVIVINEAQYGRLRIGRCVSRDYGFLGCTADVIDVLDRSCSGRRRCQLPVPHVRQLVQPCPKDLTSYLEVSYHCETGLT